MNLIDDIEREIIEDDVKNLPKRLTPKDIYNFYNKDGHIIGRDAVYSIARKLGHRFREGGRIYVNKTDFIRFIYGENDNE